MCDKSIVVIGDDYFTKLHDELKRKDYGINGKLPLVVVTDGATIELFTELERFIRGRSLLIVTLGCMEIWLNKDVTEAAEQLSQTCKQLKEKTPDLHIVVYQLPHRQADDKGKYDPKRITEYNYSVGVFNETLNQLLNGIATVRSSALNGSDHALDEFGWGPNDEGTSLIANDVANVIREHRSQVTNSISACVPIRSTCNTLIVGDRMFSGLRKDLSMCGKDTVVATSWSARSYLLSSLVDLVENCNLKICIIYLGASGMHHRKHRDTCGPTDMIQMLYSNVQILKRTNPQCRVTVCSIQSPHLKRASNCRYSFSKTNPFVQQKQQQQEDDHCKTCMFNSLLSNYDWDVCDFGLPHHKSYDSEVGKNVLNIIKLYRA